MGLQPNGIHEERRVRAALELLRKYDNGDLWAYISHRARAEGRLTPFSLPPEDEDLAQSLLQHVGNLNAQEQVIRLAGPERVVDLLQQVLVLPVSFTGGQYHLYPYLEQQAGEGTWIFEEVLVGVTGIEVVIVMRMAWSDERPWAMDAQRLDPASPLLQPFWWKGFERINDDLGHEYRLLASTTTIRGPARVRLQETNSVRMTQRQTWRWGPGPTVDATRLLFTGSVPYLVKDPSVAASWEPGTEGVRSELRCEVSLPRIDPDMWQTTPVRARPGRSW